MDMVFKIHNFFVNRVYAQSLGADLGEEIEGGLGRLGGGQIENEQDLINAVVGVAVPVAILCLIVLVVYAGYMLISSQGNPDKLQEGKEVLTNAIIGFFIIVLSVVILMLISNTLGLGIYN